MTTLSVREYVLGIYRKLGLDENQISKMQTGGPDGDLGSNEILLGHEKYTAIVDGAGVLVDPQGLDRTELFRLAKERLMISHYDVSKLSEQGYRVLVEDTQVKLPSGEIVNNGTSFRNTFHLRGEKYDLFVPCGGRPESIDLTTANKLVVDGKCTIPYIVEGANLFITQDAKLRLEKAGCILFKDASANKGGVTSSSLEVLASLSFDDEGFLEHMCVKGDGTPPAFYQDYVKEVQSIIKNNARLEFEAIWREHKATGVARSILSDRLSTSITTLDEELQNTELWDNVELRKSVLKDALPALLLEKIGLETILGRVSRRLSLCTVACIESRPLANHTIFAGSGELSARHLRQLPLITLHLRARHFRQPICFLLIVSTGLEIPDFGRDQILTHIKHEPAYGQAAIVVGAGGPRGVWNVTPEMGCNMGCHTGRGNAAFLKSRRGK